MPLKRMFIDVLLDPETKDGDPIQHRVEVRMADRLVAEQRGVSVEQQFTVGLHWAHIALKREGLIGEDLKSFEAFSKRVITAHMDPQDVTVPPTTPAASDDSASSSQPPSAAATPSG